jgi:hypothetical protein
MERGTPKWAFNLIREDCLSAFLRDLQALEAHGLVPPEGRCELVQGYLGQAASLVAKIPTASASGKPLGADFEEFGARYLNWNNPIGHDPLTRTKRAEAHARLKKQRKRIGNRARTNLPKIDDDQITWALIDQIYGVFSKMANHEMLRDVFGSFARAVRDFDRATSIYRTAQ